MTDHKHLKQHVRERMARTGEAYTTARRHVLARRPHADDATVPSAGPRPLYTGTGGGQLHDAALLRNVLAGADMTDPRTGESFTEAMIAGLAGGIGFLYAVFEYAGYGPTMSVVARHHPEPYLPAALDGAAVPYDIARTSSPTRAEAALRQALSDGRTPICTVDRTALGWHSQLDAVLGAADPHDVGVVALDDVTAWLDDECLHPTPVARSTFLDAWTRHRKGRHQLLTVIGQPTKEPDVVDAVRTTVAHLTGPVVGTSFDINFGLSGMRRLAEQLGDGRRKTGWARRFADPAALFFALRRLHDCLEVEYTAPGATRPLYAAFLDECGIAADAAALYREAGEAWSEVAASAVAPIQAYDDIVEERLRLQLCDGSAAANRIRALDDRVREVAAAYAAEPLDDRARDDLLAALAAAVTRAADLEERAVAALADSTGIRLSS